MFSITDRKTLLASIASFSMTEFDLRYRTENFKNLTAEQRIGAEALIKTVKTIKDLVDPDDFKGEGDPEYKDPKEAYNGGIHLRRKPTGAVIRTKYIYPYKADGGYDLRSSIKQDDWVYGVATKQKDAKGKTVQGYNKTITHTLVWINQHEVLDADTNQKYTHKGGQFKALYNGEVMNIRMMVPANFGEPDYEFD